MRCLLIVNNYYTLSIQEIEKIKQLDYRPRLLLHSCCAPCSAFVLEYLKNYFELTIFFNNSNIYPKEEYAKRLTELERYLKLFNEKHRTEVGLVVSKYKPEQIYNLLAVYENEREGGKRCEICFATRLEECFEYGVKNKFDYITTAMSISRQKDSQLLNKIGQQLESKYDLKYFYSDFKKKDGLLYRNQLVKKHQLYSQQYCGCKYSYQDYQERTDKHER